LGALAPLPSFPTRRSSHLATVTALLVSSMFAVGVNVAVQVTPPSPEVSALSAPFSTHTSLLSKAATASLNTIVTVEVSPIFSARSFVHTHALHCRGDSVSQ